MNSLSFKLIKVLLLLPIIASAQYINTPKSARESYLQTPLPPNAHALNKFGNLPANLNTGIPNVSFPIAEISLNGFKWPITLNYHASGIKASDVATCTGLGWSLSASGMITLMNDNENEHLQVKRDLDLAFQCSEVMTPAPFCDPTNSSDMALAEGIINGVYSSGPTLKTVILSNGINKKFIHGRSLPSSDFKLVEPTIQGAIQTLIDPDGNKYEFNEYSSNIQITSCPNITSTNTPQVLHLTKIITNKGQEIRFLYETDHYTYMQPPLKVKKKLSPNFNQFCNLIYDSVDYICPIQYSVVEKRLTKILSSSGDSLVFKYDSRIDISGSSKLNTIEIWAKSNVSFSNKKTIKFHYDYFDTNLGQSRMRLKLNGFDRYKRAEGQKEIYSFYYDENSPIPAATSDEINFINNQIVDYNISEAGSLKRIVYPTGGTTEFHYDIISSSGKLRVKSIKDSALLTGLTNVRRFEYIDSVLIGSIPVFEEVENNYYFGNPYPPICTNDWPCGQPYNWLKNCTSITWRNKPLTYMGDEFSDMGIRYIKVREYHEEGQVLAGMKELIYGIPESNRDVWDLQYILPDYLLEEKIYKSHSNDFQILQSTKHIYTTPSSYNGFYGPDLHPLEYRSYSRQIFIERPQMDLNCCITGVPFYYRYRPIFHHVNRRITSLPVYRSKTIVLKYVDGNLYSSDTSLYFYDNPEFMSVTRIIETNSKGEKIQRAFKYAYDFPDSSIFISLVQRNRVSDVILTEVLNLNSNKLVERNLLLFGTWHNNKIIEPRRNLRFFSDAKPVDDIELILYDEVGNVVELIDNIRGERSLALWGLNGTFLLAKIYNLSYSVISNVIDINKIKAPHNIVEVNQEMTKLNSIATFFNKYEYNEDGLLISITDQNGIGFKYEYNSLDQLAHIKDIQGNIIKKYCYNYAGQPINCFDQVFTNNQAASANFTRNNCPAGFTGSIVTYTIGANTVNSYISVADANAIATQRVQNEGQAYANSNGVCNPISTCNWSNCNNSGPMFNCINGFCEEGVQIHTGEVYMNWQYYCRYHYEWSDGSRSIDYYTPSFGFGCLQSNF